MIAQYTLELRNGLPSLVTEKIHYISEKGYINSETVIQLLNDTLRLNRKAEEHVVMLALNTALDIIGIFPISHGSLNESHCRGREIFQRAFLVGANGMILAHNHPSGHLEPSKEDLARKEELQQLGKLMGIYLHDFLIVSTTGAKSLMDCKSISIHTSAREVTKDSAISTEEFKFQSTLPQGK